MESLVAWVKVTQKKRLRVVDVDADRNPALARELEVSEFPTLVLIKDRRVVGRLEGRATGPSDRRAHPPAPVLVCAAAAPPLAHGSSNRNRGGRTRTCNPRFWRPVLCQLSYAPGLRGEWYRRQGRGKPRPRLWRVHRRALGLLFAALAVGLLAIAVLSALEGGRAWVIALSAAALGAWMGPRHSRALRPRD